MPVKIFFQSHPTFVPNFVIIEIISVENTKIVDFLVSSFQRALDKFFPD